MVDLELDMAVAKELGFPAEISELAKRVFIRMSADDYPPFLFSPSVDWGDAMWAAWQCDLFDVFESEFSKDTRVALTRDDSGAWHVQLTIASGEILDVLSMASEGPHAISQAIVEKQKRYPHKKEED